MQLRKAIARCGLEVAIAVRSNSLPAVRPCLDAVRRTVRSRRLWQPGTRLVLACSGGLDSLAALEILARLRPSLGHTLAVAHVEHGLWPGNAAAVEHVAAAAQAHGLDFACERLNLEHGADLEHRARTARYAALHRLRLELGGALLATAHHADDQAETLLMRMARGCGPEALAGIRAHRDDAVVRPLLGLARADLRKLADALGLSWIEDVSNADTAFLRNRLRHDVLPVLEAALPGATAGLARTAAHSADQEGVLQAWMTRALRDAWTLDPAGPSVLLRADAVPAEAPLLGSLLQHVCRHFGLAAPSLRAVEQFCAFVATKGDSHCQVRGLLVERQACAWRFTPQDVARPTGAD